MGAGPFWLPAYVAPHSRRLVYRVAQVESVGLFDRSIICALSVYRTPAPSDQRDDEKARRMENDNENAA